MTTNDTSRYQDSMVAARKRMMSDSRFTAWRTLSRRRLMVGIVGFGLTLYLVGNQFNRPIAALAGLVIFIASAVVVRIISRGVGDMPDEVLDERQRTVRNASYLTAYRLVGGLVALSLLRFFFLSSGERVPLNDVVGALTVLLFTMVVAPSCVVSWTEKDA